MLDGRTPQDKRWIGLWALALAACLVGSLGATVARTAEQAVLDARTGRRIERSKAELQHAAADIHRDLAVVSGAVEAIARQYARADEAGRQALNASLSATLDETAGEAPTLLGFGISTLRDGPPEVRFWDRMPDGTVEAKPPVALAKLERLNANSAWFHEALHEGPGWRSPIESTSPPGLLIIVYSTPICAEWPCGDLTTEQPLGVASAAIRLTGLERILRTVDLGEDADVYLADGHGRLVVHPRMERVRSQTTVHEMAAEAGDDDLARRALTALNTDAPLPAEPRVDAGTGRLEHILIERLPRTGHVLFAHVARPPVASPSELRHQLLLATLPWTTTALLAVLLVTWLAVRDPRRRAWRTSTAVSLFAMSMIGVLWWATSEHPTVRSPESTRVVGAGDLAEFEDRWRRMSRAQDVGEPAFVPTGVFLQSIEFESANNVVVSGVVWQKLRCAEDAMGSAERAVAIDCDADDDALAPGFFFPEADPGEELQVGLAYRRRGLGAQVLGWRFRALLRQDFNYDPYPFDRQEVWLRILPRDFDDNVVLVPDLLAYDRTHPEARPGLEDELVLPGWDIEGAGFYYRWRDYDTDFGIPGYVGQSGFPEFVYSVRIGRSFLGPFVSKIIPLGVAASMLFCMVLLGTRRDEHAERFGFSALEIVLGAAALFFVVIFDHSALREDLATVRPFYLEYFYFGMYVALMTSCMNAIAFAMGGIRWIQFQDNLLAKVLFWPAYLLGLAGVTAVFFF